MEDKKQIKTIIRKLLIYLGLDEASSSVYSILITSNKGLNAKELADNTGYSIATVYASINKLKTLNLVEKQKDKNSVTYHANLNFMDLFNMKRKTIIENYLAPLIDVTKNSPYKQLKKYCKTVYSYLEKLNPQI